MVGSRKLHGAAFRYDEVLPIVAGGTHNMLISHECIQGMIESEALTVHIHRYQEGGFSTPNVHPHCEQVYVVKEGEGEVMVGGKTAPIKAGSVIFIPRHAPHCVKNTGKGELVMVFISVVLDGPQKPARARTHEEYSHRTSPRS